MYSCDLISPFLSLIICKYACCLCVSIEVHTSKNQLYLLYMSPSLTLNANVSGTVLICVRCPEQTYICLKYVLICWDILYLMYSCLLQFVGVICVFVCSLTLGCLILYLILLDHFKNFACSIVVMILAVISFNVSCSFKLSLCKIYCFRCHFCLCVILCRFFVSTQQ